MKKIFLLMIIAGILQAKIITILDNNIVRKVEINIPSSKMQARMLNYTNYNELIIKLKNNIDPNNFAKEFHLTLKKALKLKNYYIFINTSSQSDFELIAQIIQKAKNKIITIRPNYGFDTIAR